ncbi:MAG: histidine kinase [Lapillicoccus sp.]
MSEDRATDLTAPQPLRAWSSAWRYLLVVAAGSAVWGGTAVDAIGESSTLSPQRAFLTLALDALLGLLGLGVMAFRRRWPIGVVLALTALSCFSASVVGPWAMSVVSLATRRRWREVLPIGLASMLSPLVYGWVNPISVQDLPWWVAYAIGLLAYAVLVMIGFYAGARRELFAGLRLRAETTEHEQAMRVAQAKEQERTRIAREMHDVLAHRISLVAMHAGALTYRDDLTREQTREAAGIIQDGAHQALTDLREVLGVLRDPGAERDSLVRPQPTLGDLPALVSEAVEGGMQVRLLDERPAGVTVPVATGRAVYRMVQEGLTNARKHAPGVPVSVRISGAPGARLHLEVRNRLPLRAAAVGSSVPGAGMGLTGLAERAALADGSLEHGPTPGHEFVVRAWLPWPA